MTTPREADRKAQRCPSCNCEILEDDQRVLCNCECHPTGKAIWSQPSSRVERLDRALSMAQSTIGLLSSMVRCGEDFSPSSNLIINEFKAMAESALRKGPEDGE